MKLGPWPTSGLIATSGQADGDVIANAPVLWNHGMNFGMWERTTTCRVAAGADRVWEADRPGPVDPQPCPGSMASRTARPRAP
jgi:hypothetical protein